MRRLTPPTRNVIADYDTARSRRSPNSAALLRMARPSVLGAYGLYEAAAAAPYPLGRLETGAATMDALRSNFDLLNKGRALSDLRSDVLASARQTFGRCPLCEIGRVSAIDHYLPRNRYPEFSILASNLVPVCERCNRLKKDDCPAVGGRSYFHCYFDTPIDVAVVHVTLIFASAVGVEYRLQRRSAVPGEAYAKLEAAFDMFDLARHYQEEAVSELVSNASSFHRIFQEFGADELRAHLENLRDTRIERAGLNNWESALYRALAGSERFCGGDYETLLSTADVM